MMYCFEDGQNKTKINQNPLSLIRLYEIERV